MTDKPKFLDLTPEQHKAVDEQIEATRFEREQATGPLHWGLTVLHGELAQMAKLYRSGEKQDQGDAIVGQIFAVQRFLRSQGITEQTVEPMMRPITALNERENNRLDPLFNERKRGGKPSRSLADYERIGALATLADAYLLLNSDQEGRTEQKLRRFAREASCDWFGTLTYSKVKAARELVSQENTEHPAVSWARLYRTHIDAVESYGGEQAGYDILLRFIHKHKANY